MNFAEKKIMNKKEKIVNLLKEVGAKLLISAIVKYLLKLLDYLIPIINESLF